ncbi:hypothetical protein BGX28_002359 [Mortierella sp. GBA30]|nr:hypothetical protein BGX28_002359 [Mortierella sp. GBA30]
MQSCWSAKYIPFYILPKFTLFYKFNLSGCVISRVRVGVRIRNTATRGTGEDYGTHKRYSDGTLIGTGIFASPGPLFDSVHCTQTSFIIWAFAGIVCTIGAFAYAELGTMFPESGGDFQYLSRAYGKKVALVFGWCFITILNPIGTAGIAGVLGRYSVDMMTYFRTGTSAGMGGAGASSAHHLTGFSGVGGIGAGMALIAAGGGASQLNGTGFWVPHAHSPYGPGSFAFQHFPKDPLPSDQMEASGGGAGGGHVEDMPWVIRTFSIGSIIVMGLINIFFKEGGKYASNILAIFKIAGMCMLIVIGSVQAVKNHAQSEALSIPIGESSQNVLDYVSALCFAFFAYNGFNNINLGLGELRDPERNLKRAVWIAMPFVTLLFLLANFAFFSILSSYDLRHVHSLSLHAGHTVLGQPGGFLMAGTVVASALGSINANIWAGSRLLVIMAKDNTVMPFSVGKVWTRTGTQAIAIIILVVQASVHALVNLDFKTFSKIYSAVGWSWYGISIAGLLYLRRKRPSYPRPVKVFWPLASAFVMVAFFLVVGSLTLAFMSVSAPSGEEEDSSNSNNNKAARYTPVIMFGAVIVFMMGVVPAFYMTRCISRRKLQKQNSQDQDGRHHNMVNGMDGDENQGRYHGYVRDCTRGEGYMLGALESKCEQEKDSNGDGSSRRHSTASSITLVGEAKRGKRRQRQDRQDSKRSQNCHHQDQCRSGPSRNNSYSQQVAEEDEEEMIRIQHLRVARLNRRKSVEGAEMGESKRSSMDTGDPDDSCFSPLASSRCVTPLFYNSPSEGVTPSASNCPTRSSSPSPYAMEGGWKRQQLLGLPGGSRSDSRSSDGTIALDPDEFLQAKAFASSYEDADLSWGYDGEDNQRQRLEGQASADSMEQLMDQPRVQVPEILFDHFFSATERAANPRLEGTESSSDDGTDPQHLVMTLSPQLIAATIQDDPELVKAVQESVATHPDTAQVMTRLLTYIQSKQLASSSTQPDAKRQRLDQGLGLGSTAATSASFSSASPSISAVISSPPQPALGPEIYSTTPLSFLHPVRKKLVLSFHQNDIALVSATNSSEIVCRAPYKLIHRVISVPFLERTKKQTAIILFFKHTDITPAKDAIWAVPVSDDGKDLTVHFHDQHKQVAGLDDDLRSLTSTIKTPVPLLAASQKRRPDQILVSILSYFIHRSDPSNYSSAVDMIPNPTSPSPPYPSFTAHLKSNSATIYLLPTGILFAFRKPLLFLPSKSIEAVGIHSVLSRTFDFEVVMDPNASSEDLEGVPVDSKDGRRAIGFGMVDTKEFARMEEWIKKAGIRDRSLSEDLKAKDKAPVTLNSKKRERTADDGDNDGDDGDTEATKGQGNKNDDDDDDEEDEDFAPESDDEIMEEYDSNAEGSESEGEEKETRKTRVQMEQDNESGGEDDVDLEEESLGEDSEDEDENEEQDDNGYGQGEVDEEEVDELQDD